MKLRALAGFCRRMGVALHAGVDILRILESETKTGSPQHREVMKRIHEKVRDGNSLSRAMLDEKKVFPPLLIQLLHAAELGGRMESMFLTMADYYEDLIRTRSYFLGQITMPVIQLVIAITIIGLVILILGMINSGNEIAYDAAGLGLKGMSGFAIYCLVVGSIASVSALVIFAILKNWFNLHKKLMPIARRIPTLGTALTTLAVARFSMTLSMLLNAGVEARRSLKQAFLATGNHYFVGGMDTALAEIEKGNSFGDAVDASGVFPDEFLEMLRTGELSGTETESLDHLAHIFQDRAKAALKMLATIVSTIIWLAVTILIAAFIIRLAMQYVSMLYSFM